MNTLASLLDDRLAAVLFYGALLALVTVAGWASGMICLRKLTCWLCLSWMASNVAFAAIGPEHAPWVVPAINALITANIARLAMAHRCRTSWEVTRLYCLELGLIVVAFSLHRQGDVLYYAALNLVFVARLAVAGGASGMELANRADLRDFCFLHWRLGRV